MLPINDIGMILGGSWASGVNLYLTVAGLGLADKFGIVDLPAGLEVISNPLVITLAVIVYGVEFFADKIPYVDSAWDSVHTFIRPAGAAAMAYSAFSGSNEMMQTSMALLGGTVALDSHLTKATTRAAINTSPEPFSNSVASISEDALVVTVLWLIAKHPVIASIAVIVFIVFSIWFLKIMFKFLKNVFGAIFGKKPIEKVEATVETIKE
jgi:Domain of unknown function (DUF4126)